LKKHIPNCITLLNLLCGCFGIHSALYPDISNVAQLQLAGMYIWLGLGFDFADGLVARLLKVQSPIGKQLDSLADMVTFGVLPGLIMGRLFVLDALPQSPNTPWALLAFVIPLASALRLAKFNVDERQSTQFYGLPTPAFALLVSGLPWYLSLDPNHAVGQVLLSTPVLAVICLLFSYLLLSPLPMPTFKFKTYGWQQNWQRYALLALMLAALVAGGPLGLPYVIIFYVTLGFIAYLKQRT